MKSPPPLQHEARPEWIGHRGAPREHLENTLPAFERALELGADAIELDVHATADGVVIVHHDPVLTLDASARLEIEATPWAALGHRELRPGVSIPTLAQVLDLVARRARVYVEIKAPRIESFVVDVIRRSNAECAVHSFDHDIIARMRGIAPELPRGILFDMRPANVAAAMQRTGARDAWPHWSLIDESLVAEIRAEGGRVIAWTVNSLSDAEALVRCGVDGICSDDLRQFAAVRS